MYYFDGQYYFNYYIYLKIKKCFISRDLCNYNFTSKILRCKG